jgi:hypothetical protein
MSAWSVTTVMHNCTHCTADSATQPLPCRAACCRGMHARGGRPWAARPPAKHAWGPAAADTHLPQGIHTQSCMLQHQETSGAHMHNHDATPFQMLRRGAPGFAAALTLSGVCGMCDTRICASKFHAGRRTNVLRLWAYTHCLRKAAADVQLHRTHASHLQASNTKPM